ncbi:sigma-54-dependent transcriptional regulator [Acidicapsa acidisoli]|uniref:sigma-54-dependent transcriptional regulator n=1 Tax=Acidicapsa acidisoli TaxID=1615681 RepID=UPI0021E05D6E|nr:sigma-54 dependent transcriptional regulator [Acidicapsa acidisoli]
MLETVLQSTIMEYFPQNLETQETQESQGPSNRKVRMHLLVVDTDAAVRSACAEIATSLGYAVQSTADLAQAKSLVSSRAADILLVNLPYGGYHALDLVSEVKVLHPATAVIAMTASSSVNAAVEAMRRGASDYLTKPFAVDELSAVLERAAATVAVDAESRQLRERLRLSQGLGSMIGRSAEMEKLYRILSKVAQSTHPVLVLGESGTGKELVARTIHAYGPNAYKPFLPVDCGSLVPTLIESELFGYVKGAFTGASKSKDGLFVSAEGGTVFLDEIGELTLDLQAKLLRALQEKEVRPVGATHRVPIKARIVAATNRDLAAMVEKGSFRKDLFYRLNVVNLRLPALRDRREDIPLLTAHFLERMSKGQPVKFSLSNEALRTMMQHDWPGNIRELEHCIERACALSSGPVLELGDLPTQLQQQGLDAHRVAAKAETVSAEGAADVVPLAELERQAILSAIRKLGGDKLLAARLLGIGKTTLYRKLKEYGITDPLLEEE